MVEIQIRFLEGLAAILTTETVPLENVFSMEFNFLDGKSVKKFENDYFGQSNEMTDGVEVISGIIFAIFG